ncbi:unnamed protein product [Leuciscus chuanchicus]
MPLPEENADEPPYAPKDGTTTLYKNTPLSRRPSILTFASEPFIQQTFFKRESGCTFDLPHHKNFYSVSECASGSKYARRDTTSDATALICCNTAAKHKREQWKTQERDFTEDSSLSTISKKDSQPTCFNSADVAYKPQKEAFAFQKQDERLSSSTFHELLESSWMSANLHCSMLHFDTTEQAVSFVEHKTANLSGSTSAVSFLAVPVVTESERHSCYIPRGLAGRNELVSIHGQYLTSHQHSPFAKCKALAATEAQISAQLDVTPEAYDDFDEKKIEERSEDLYRFRLRLRCLRMWSKRLRLLSQACCHDRRRVLNKALYVLRWAAKMHCARTDAVERRRSNFILYQSFYQWKNHYESNTDALRKRLIQPSRTFLMTTCSTWRNLRLLRTAVIHYHLSVLYKHWLLWRQVCSKQFSRRQQELWACVCWDRRLQSKVWTLWILTWQRKQLATDQYRMHLLASAWKKWKIRYRQKKLEKLMQSTQTSNLLHSFHRWQKRAESCKREREKQLVLSRRTLNSWHCYVQKTKLTRLSTRVPWVLSRRMLAVNFRKWRDVTRRMQETRICLERVCHLQDKSRIQTRFTIWLKSARQRKELRRVRENLQRAQLSGCLSAWRSLVQRSALLLHYCYRRKALTLKTCLQQWRRSLQLHCLQKDFLIHQFHTRQKNTGCTMEVFKWKTRFSAQELSSMLLLHNTFHKWTEILVKQQLAQSHRSAKDRAVQRVVLLEWYRHTQAVFSDAVLLFTAKLAHLHPSSSSSPCSVSTAVPQGSLVECKNCTAEDDSLERSVLTHREQHCPLQATESQHSHMSRTISEEHRSLLSLISKISDEYEDPGDERMAYSCFWGSYGHCRLCRSKVVLLRALGRMMHPDLSLLFSQWRSLVHTNREMRLQGDLCRKRRRCKDLTVAFRVWRAHTQIHCRAVRHWERRVIFHTVIQWKIMVWQRCRKRMLEQHATLTHDTNLLRHCFCIWTRMAVGPYCEQQTCAVEQMESKAERHRLNLSFSTWVTCVSQQQTAKAVYIRTLQNRVFWAWLRCVQVCKQRQASALFFSHYRLLRVCFCQWRIICVHQRHANSILQHRLHLRVKVILQQWRKHENYKAHRQALLCEYDERRKTVMKRRTFLMWSQTEKYFRRSQHYHQRVLKHRYFSQWLHEFRHQSELLCISRELEEVRTQRIQQRAFCLWKLKERLVERKRAQLVMHRWRQHISRARKRRNITQTMKNMFLCWKAAFRQSVRSREHCTQRQQRRVLLAWSRHTVSEQRLRYREAWFQYSSEMRLLAAVFMQWRRVLIQGQQKKCTMESQLIIYQRRAFHRWRTAATECRAIQTFNNRLLHKWFKHWTHSWDLLKVADMFCVKKERSEARLALRTWSLWAKDHKAQRQMGEAVSLWLEGRGVSRSFHHWVKVYQQYQKASLHRQLSHSHVRAVERRVYGLTHLYWTCWKNQTEASLLYTQQYERSVLQKAWLTWRKRRIRNRVSADHSANFNNMLLAQLMFNITSADGSAPNPSSSSPLSNRPNSGMDFEI